jgi:putative toxin-antitoxin system antitoxin component (TIGR02293 family)
MIDALGMEPTATPMALIRQIEAGLPISAFNRITGHIAPDDVNFRFLIIPKATLTRRNKSKQLSPGESEVVARLAKVWEMAVDVYKSEDTARRFLHQPHSLLEGRTPISVALGTSAGARLIEEILGRLQYGSAP